MNGKSGTVTPAEFDLLSGAVNQYGARVLAQKVAKICSKKASALKHEFAASSIAAAYDGIASKITGFVGTTGARPVSTDLFNSLTGMVALYGPEVVTWKLAKIAKRVGNAADSAILSSVFPRSCSKSSLPSRAASLTGRTR